MPEAVRRRLSFANVISMIALFVALGGVGAYAADKLGSKDIGRNAIKSKHVKDDKLTGDDVNEDSLGMVPSAQDAETIDGVDSFNLQFGNGFDNAAAGFIDDGDSATYLALGGDVIVDCDTSPSVVWDDLGGDGGVTTDLWMGGQYQEVADGATSTARNFDTTLTHEVQAWAGDDTISLVHVSVFPPNPTECPVAFTAQEHFNSASLAQAQAARERTERDGRGGAVGLRGR